MTLGQILFELRAAQVEKLKILTKSRTITLNKQNKSTSESPSTQLDQLSNIPVRFHDSRSNTFELRATQV
jgi:hypothetical protein